MRECLHKELEKVYVEDSGDPWVVGLSGGVDSTALLYIVREFLKEKKATIPLVAVYINHGLQEMSSEWAQVCEHSAKACGAVFVHGCVALEDSLVKKRGVEAEARRVRQSFLGGVCRALNSTVLLLGSHQDDRLEGMLLNVIRGSGIAGVVSLKKYAWQEYAVGGSLTVEACTHVEYEKKLQEEIPAMRYRLQVVRPFLDCSKRELKTVCEKVPLTWVEDPSNQCEEYGRNIVRKALQTLEDKMGGHRVGWRKSLARSFEVLEQSAKALEEQKQEDLGRAQERCAPKNVLERLGEWKVCVVLKEEPLLTLSDFRLRNVITGALQLCDISFALPYVQQEQLAHLVRSKNKEKWTRFETHGVRVVRTKDHVWFLKQEV